jgi:hypothetical protein
MRFEESSSSLRVNSRTKKAKRLAAVFEFNTGPVAFGTELFPLTVLALFAKGDPRIAVVNLFGFSRNVLDLLLAFHGDRLECLGVEIHGLQVN